MRLKTTDLKRRWKEIFRYLASYTEDRKTCWRSHIVIPRNVELKMKQKKKLRENFAMAQIVLKVHYHGNAWKIPKFLIALTNCALQEVHFRNNSLIAQESFMELRTGLSRLCVAVREMWFADSVHFASPVNLWSSYLCRGFISRLSASLKKICSHSNSKSRLFLL